MCWKDTSRRKGSSAIEPASPFHFLDADHKSLQTVYSIRLQNTNGWTKVRLGPFHAADEAARFAVIGLNLEPTETGPTRQADLRGRTV